MFKKNIAIVFIAICIFSIKAQNYTIINGPTSFMRSNLMGSEFENINYNSAKGAYTFIYSSKDDKKPWSVVSLSGSAIYTKLDLRNVDINYKIYVLTPVLTLSSTKSYTYSQYVYGIVNDGAQTTKSTKLALKLVKGYPAYFTVAAMEQTDSLKQFSVFTSTRGYFKVENIIPTSTSNYYFALEIDPSAFIPMSDLYMSIGFQYNTITENIPSGITQPKSVQISNAFPNPTNGLIRFTGFAGEVEIVNLQGQVIKKLNKYLEENIDLGALQCGIYFAKNKGLVARFIKN